MEEQGGEEVDRETVTVEFLERGLEGPARLLRVAARQLLRVLQQQDALHKRHRVHRRDPLPDRHDVPARGAINEYNN